MGTATHAVGPFRVLGLLGEGGTARVYLAERGRSGRRVALKVLRPNVADRPGARAELLREAAVTAAVGHHPNVVALDTVTRTAGGALVVALEHVPGEPLLARIQRLGPRPTHEVLAVAAQLADALGELHRRGILHRDVKSANVLVVEEPGGLKATLIDLGVAVEREQVAARGGAMVGTPMYMAPEQALGDPLDDRCDVYALGVVLFEMLTGTVPFDGDRVDEVIRKLVSEPAPRPSDVLGPARSIDPALDLVVHRCLAKAPHERPSLLEIGRALAVIVAEQRTRAAVAAVAAATPPPVLAPPAIAAPEPRALAVARPVVPTRIAASSSLAGRLHVALTVVLLALIVALGAIGYAAAAFLPTDFLAGVVR